MGPPWPASWSGREICPARRTRWAGHPYLVVLAVRVAAAAVGQDAALAIEDVAGVALAALHAVVVAVALQADRGAAGLAHAHAALVVAVGRAGDGWNGRRESRSTVTRTVNAFLWPIAHPLAETEARRGGSFATFPLSYSLCLWKASI